MMPPCVRMLVRVCELSNRSFSSSERLVGTGASAIRTSPVDQRGDGIPPQAAINPTWRDTLIFCGLLFHLRDSARKGCLFFNMYRYCKSTRHQICKYQRQIKKKATGKFFFSRFPLLFPISFSLLLICVGEPMVHYNWPLSSCR